MATTRRTSYTREYLRITWDNKLQPAIDRREPGQRVVCVEYAGSSCSRFYAPVSSDDFARISAKNRHLYEVILGDLPRQLYFDFEVYDRTQEEAADVLNEIRNTIAKHFGDIHLAISGSVATVTRDGEEKVKHSYHVTCPDIVYANWQEQHENLHDFVEFYKKDGFDPAVYGRTSQLMKMVGQSKRGDPRVQVIVQDDVRENHFITAFLKEGAGPAKPRDVPHAVPEASVSSVRRGGGFPVDLTGIVPVPFVAEIPPKWNIRKSPISETLKLLYHDDGANRLDRTTRYVILKWIQTRGGTFEDFLGFMRGGRPLTCDKIEKYRKEWEADTKGVKDNTIMAILRVLHPAVEFGNKQLREHRWYHDVKPTNYVSAARQFTVPEAFDGEMGRPGRSYVSGQDLTEHKVDIWALPLGSGKTSGMLEIVKSNPTKRVLIVTCRKTLVSDIFGRALAEGLSAVQYLDVRDKTTMGSHNFLLVQGESLHYLADAKPYDIIFIDEWESFMNTWLSRDTHKDNMRKNWNTFMTLWECSKKIVLMDAFVTRKSTEFMEIMGDEYRILGSRHSAPTRTMQYIQFPKMEGGYMPNDYRITAVSDLVVNDLRAGKNIFMFYPYKKGSGRACSIMDLRRHILESAGIEDREDVSTVYFGDQDDEIKNGLKRTDRAFAGKRLVISNSCITVGVSYTGYDFDKMYILRSNFVGVRDIIQFSYRTRRLRENTVVVADLPTKTHELVFSGDSSRMANAKHLDAFRLLERYAEFEKKTTSEDIMRHYAGLAGYQVVDVDYKLHPITSRTKTFIDELMLDNTHSDDCIIVSWESVADIDRRELNTLKEMQAKNEPLTYAQKLAIQKWFFRDLFIITAPTVFLKDTWEYTMGIKIAHCVTNFVRNEWKHAEYLEPTRLGELKLFLTGGIDSVEDISEFTPTEKAVIRKEFGLASFTPGRRCSKCKLISVLLDYFFGAPLISRSPATKRYEVSKELCETARDVYRYMRMPNDEEYMADEHHEDDEDAYYRQKRLRPLDPKPLSEYTFQSGKFRGKTFEQVASDPMNRGYCQWVKHKKDLAGAMSVFREYLISERS
eukprot:jgi/Tetstr1/432578/TSEL_021948.t1